MDSPSVHNSPNPWLTFRSRSCVLFRPASSLSLLNLSLSGLLSQQMVITLTRLRSIPGPWWTPRAFLLSSWRAQNVHWPSLSYRHKTSLKPSKFDSYVLISSASISSGLEILNQRKPCRTSGMKKVPSVVWSCLCLFFSLSASSAFTCSPTCTDSAFVKALTPLLPLSRPALIACVRILGTSSTRSSHCQSCPAFIRLSSFHVVVSLGLYLPRGKIRILSLLC